MNLFNIIGGVCSILGLLVSLFTASKVVKITQTINIGNEDDHTQNSIKIKNGKVGGDVLTGDKKHVEK